MPYKVIEEIKNITDIHYNDFHSFDVIRKSGLSYNEWSDIYASEATKLSASSTDITILKDFIINGSSNSNWNSDTQTAIRIVYWPNQSLYQLFVNITSLVISPEKAALNDSLFTTTILSEAEV